VLTVIVTLDSPCDKPEEKERSVTTICISILLNTVVISCFSAIFYLYTTMGCVALTHYDGHFITWIA